MDSRIISDLLRGPRFSPIAVGVVGIAGGFTAGYFYGKRKSTITYYESPDEVNPEVPFKATINDLENARDSERTDVSNILDEGAVIRITDPRPDPSDIEVDQDPMEGDVSNLAEDIEDEMANRSTVNIFARGTEDWDYDSELKRRESNHVYIIHVDEFFGKETGFDQNTLTYYAGDDIMADDANTPVYGFVNLVGELRFGHGSNDVNVVYVRNEDRKCEYEILFDPGSFSTEVLGIYAEDAVDEDEVRHSRNLMKFRLE